MQSSKYFKLVCVSGNEDLDVVEYLAYIYTIAGCAGFDVLVSPKIVKAAKAINAALIKTKEFKINIHFVPFITVSVGIPGDHHVRKAIITDDFVSCNLCIPT